MYLNCSCDDNTLGGDAGQGSAAVGQNGKHVSQEQQVPRWVI